MKLIIARHGQDEDNANSLFNGRRDTPLTPLGREQAHLLSAALQSFLIDIIYTSPLKRAYETAGIVAEELEVRTLVSDERLVEREYGILTGKSLVDIAEFATQTEVIGGHNYTIEAPGAESFPEVYARVARFLEECKKKHVNHTVLVICHGDTSKMLVASFYGWGWKKALEQSYLKNAEYLVLERAL